MNGQAVSQISPLFSSYQNMVPSQKVGAFVGRIGNPAGRNIIPTYIPLDY